jgi:hypothetical protein
MRNQRERGQVIYILAIGIITLLGFSALAIDGARLFSERRNAQGVSDTAAFTAASYIGQYDQDYLDANFDSTVEDHAEQAALERIRSNGYTGAEYNPFGVNDRLRISIIEESETYSKSYLVRVDLISEIQPVFAQLIYHGEMLVNVKSHAVVMPRNNLGFGQAMVSLSEDECNALDFTGTTDINVLGTGIYAASDCANAINFTGGADATIEDSITTVGGIDSDGNSTYASSTVVEGVEPQPFPSVPLPDCSGLPTGTWVRDNATKETTFFPGRYGSKLIINSVNFKQIFQPGLYCLAHGMSVLNGDLHGDGVTFYIVNYNVTVTGGDLNLTAPTNGEADDGTNSWDGMLFYVANGNWTVAGGANSYLEGTVYAPAPKPKGVCKLTGGGATQSFNLQLICDTILLDGGAGLDILFDNTNSYTPPVSIDLIQ